MRQYAYRWKRTVASAALLMVGVLGVVGACGTNVGGAPPLEDMSETLALFDLPGLTFTGTCTFNTTNGNLIVALQPNDTVLIGRSASTGGITVNGNTLYCGNANYLNVNDMNVFVTGGGVGTAEAVVLDYSNGSFAWATAAAGTGTQYDTGGGNGGADSDTLQIRMQNSNSINQNITVGANGIHLAGTGVRDIWIQNAHNPNAITIAMGNGNDRFNGMGDPNVGGAPAATRLIVYGYGGTDVIYTSGGNFNDEYYGGDGNDSLVVAAAVLTAGEMVLDGGNDFDTVTFASRTLPVNLVIGGGYVSGDIATPELHSITSTVESLVGGADADTISGGAAGTNAVLYGGPGNDNFVQLGATAGDSNDTIWGGAGTDTVNYAQRTVAVSVTLDGNPNDGAISTTGERDNVQTDVEKVITGAGNDVLVGNGNDNVLNAGAGTNTLYGLAGDDTFMQDIAGTDTIYGGAGVDTVDYENRAAAITAALDGATSSGASGENDVLSTDIENLVGGSGNFARSSRETPAIMSLAPELRAMAPAPSIAKVEPTWRFTGSPSPTAR